MQPVLILRHVDCEGPGYLGPVLERSGIPASVVAIDQGDAVPEDITPYSGLVLMGGPMSVNDPLPWIAAELELIREAQRQDKPVLGHCLGGQLIAKALGGEVRPAGRKEIGWHPVTVVDNTVALRWCQGLPASFDAFHWHGESFSIPTGATRILQSSACPNQAFVLGRILAFQCHVEMTGELVHNWVDRYRDELATPSETVQSAPEIGRDLENRLMALHGIADVFYQRWLSMLSGGRS